jgi:hypothetical protein
MGAGKGGAHCAGGRGECGTTPQHARTGCKWALALTASAGHTMTVINRA